MKKILIPTDFSDCANKAVEVALKMGKQQDTELHFLHIIDIPADWISMVGAVETDLYADVTARVREHEQELSKLVKQAEEAGLSARKHIFYNKSYKGILEYAEEHKVNLIIMGSHGASGFKEWLMGSNAQHVVRDATVPVLVVKGDTDRLNLSKLLVHSDFEPDELQNFVPVVDLAKDLQAKIDLLLVCIPSDFYATPEADMRLDLYASAAPALMGEKRVFNAERQELGLAACMDEEDRGLLTMLYNRKKARSSYTRKHVEELINHLDVPVLSIPAN